MKKKDDQTFILKAKVKNSLGLNSWILSWGSKAKVLSPKSLVEAIKREKMKTIEQHRQT
ncbi:WYL domain-containing protein [Halalkalibacter nanhaiisediminis]|uniref:WYL domain-containing protein n=1 Tax=Halalkalibacter nanhaiisediminis TaxID=688079 RepID=UPI0024112B6E|nr:WYL domain-containing protein [Halalkalibacter nanhaiisediminis]